MESKAAPSLEGKKGWTWSKLKQRVQNDPVVFVCLGCTVGALTLGLRAMLRNDKRQSQSMMRFRVFFQLCTVGALMTGIYVRAYNGDFDTKPKGPRVDNRAYMVDPRAYDLVAAVATDQGEVVLDVEAQKVGGGSDSKEQLR